MKTRLLFLFSLAYCGFYANAQTFDHPNFDPNRQSGTQLFEDKASNYGQFCGYKLSGASTANNGNDGVMFKIKANENIVINGFSSIFQIDASSSGFVRIYRKSGTYTGVEANPSSWQLVDSAFVNADGTLKYVGTDLGMYVAAGSEASFYLQSSAVSIDYNDGTTEGAALSQNQDLVLYEGIGLNGTFGATYSPRQFVGNIHYCKPSQISCDTTLTQYNNENGNAGVFFNLVSKSNDINVENIFTDLAGTYGRVRIFTKTGTYEGSETNSAAWTLLDSAYIASPSNNNAEAISSGFSLSIPANSVMGVHIVCDGYLSLDYSNGITFTDTIRNEQYIAVVGGKGADGTFIDNASARKFNGTIAYCASFLSVDENLSEQFNVYPNPAYEYISVSTGNAQIQQICIMDISGKTVYNTTVQSAGNSYQLDISELVAGSYFIKVTSKNSTSTRTFIKN